MRNWRSLRRVAWILLLFTGYCVAPISYESARIGPPGVKAQGGVSVVATQGEYEVTSCGTRTQYPYTLTGVRVGGEVALGAENVQLGVDGAGGYAVYQDQGSQAQLMPIPEAHVSLKISYPMEQSALAMKVAWGLSFPYVVFLADLGNPARWTLGAGPILLLEDTLGMGTGGVFWLIRHPQEKGKPVYSLGVAGLQSPNGEWFTSITVGMGWRLK